MKTKMSADFQICISVPLNKHVPIKKKYARVNQAPFIKNLKKTIMHCSKLTNIFLRDRSDKNKTNFNKQRNYCFSLLSRAEYYDIMTI